MVQSPSNLSLFMDGKKNEWIADHPFEITKHTLHFHENASIYGMTVTEQHLFTAGSDCNVRCWHITLKEKKQRNMLCYPDSSSVVFTYCCTLTLPNSVCAVRAHKKYIAAGTTMGDVFVFKEKGCTFDEYMVRGGNGNSCNDVVFVKDNFVVFGFENGELIMYKIIENSLDSSNNSEDTVNDGVLDARLNVEDSTNNQHRKKRIRPSRVTRSLSCELISTQKLHSLAIEGLCYNIKYNILCSFSKDQTMKVFYVEDKLSLLAKVDHMFADEQEMILFRKYTFSHDHDFLYVGGCLNKYMHIFHFPFHSACVLGKIGPFESHVSVIFEYGRRNATDLSSSHNGKKDDFKKFKKQWYGTDNKESTNHVPNRRTTLLDLFSASKNAKTNNQTNDKNVETKVLNGLPSQALKDNATQTKTFSEHTENNTLVEEDYVSNLVFFAVRNSLYCMDRHKIICKIENLCYKGITDIVVFKNVVFVSSVDGLISSVKFFS